MGGCPARPAGVVADADEQRRRPLAQSGQVAAVASGKLTWAAKTSESVPESHAKMGRNLLRPYKNKEASSAQDKFCLAPARRESRNQS
jgi:hypothetical protein